MPTFQFEAMDKTGQEVRDTIEAATQEEAQAMIKAGEAGGALEIILKRLAEFQERAQSLKRKVRGAMVYPIFVVLFAVTILVFIMLKIVPQFEKIFRDFGTKLPDITQMLISIS